MFKTWSIKHKDSTQTLAMQTIYDINDRYPIMYVAVDAGFGTTQIEDMKKWGKEHPGSGLDRKIFPVEFGGKTELIDPITKDPSKKWTKPFMVGLLQKLVEDHDIIISKTEEDSKYRLIGQIREYRVKSTSSQTDRPSYVTENDHILDALMCAVYCFHMKHGDYTFVQYTQKSAYTSKNPFVNQDQFEIKSRWEGGDGRTKIAQKTPEPKLMEKAIEAGMTYSYTLDKRAAHDDPDTEYIIKRDGGSPGGPSSGPWSSRSSNINSRGSVGQKPKGRSIRSPRSPQSPWYPGR